MFSMFFEERHIASPSFMVKVSVSTLYIMFRGVGYCASFRRSVHMLYKVDQFQGALHPILQYLLFIIRNNG
jgi:hypothetical protein